MVPLLFDVLDVFDVFDKLKRHVLIRTVKLTDFFHESIHRINFGIGAPSHPTYQPPMSMSVVALHILRYCFGTPTYQKRGRI